MRQEAQRLDDGGVWGARIGVPHDMSQATSESFVLTVVGSSGNVATYAGSASVTMNGVVWQDDADPANPNDWSQLLVHQSDANTPNSQASSASLSSHEELGVQSAGDWSLSLDDLFAEYGTFSVYRLKPYALPPEALASEPYAEGFSTIVPLSVSIENATGATAGWNLTLFEDAFELVDPALEPAVYASTASSGGYFRTMKWLRAGMLVAWDGTRTVGGIVGEEAIAQGASFIFGSDDPRARGRLSGDIVAGILVYGDARDVVVGAITDDTFKLALGGIGIGLTFVGPEADGPFAAFKSGVKLIRSVPTVGPRVAIKLLTDVRDEIKIARTANDGVHALRFLANEADIATWAARNTDKLADFERVSATFDRGIVNSLALELDNVVPLSADMARAFPGDEVAAQAALRRLAQPSTMLGQGGEEAIRQVGEATKGLRDVSPDAVPSFLRDIDAIRNVEGADTWWAKARGGLSSEGDGHLGYAFEASQSAKLLQEGKLSGIDDAIDGVLYNGQPTSVQVDAFAKGPEGKKILTEFKSKKDPAKAVGSNYDTRTQMERQAKAVSDKSDDAAFNLEREIHWRFSSRPTEPLKDYASQMEKTYGVRFRFFDAGGIEFTPV